MNRDGQFLSLSSTSERTLRLTGMVGPFFHVHKKLIDAAQAAGKIKILHSPLSCFEVKFKVSIGSDELAEYNFSPTDLKPTASQFHQILMFSFPVFIPEPFFILPNLTVSVTLLHKIEDFEPVFVATGKTSELVGDVIFTISDGNENESEKYVMIDLIKQHLNTFVIPIYRSPSPISRDIRSQSDYFTSDMTSNDLNHPFIGDLEKYAAAVTHVFSVFMTAPTLPVPKGEEIVDTITRPRFFKDDQTPKYDVIPQLKQIINNPFIAGFSDADFQFLKKYKKYVSTFPSGFLKLASKDIFVSQPDLPFIFALYCLRLDEASMPITKHAGRCLRKANMDIVKNFVECLIQTSMYSQEASEFMYEKCAEDDELAVSVYWALRLELENSNNKPLAARFLKHLDENVFSKELSEDIHNGEMVMEKLKEIIIGVKTLPKAEKVNYVRERIKPGFVEKPFRLPLKPSFVVESISQENIIVFGSSLQPVKLDFVDKSGKIFSAILKVGDDMRQDALALSLVNFMDDRLKRYGYDLCMTPYKVLPMTLTYGMCEYVVGAKALSKVLADNQQSIENYLDYNYDALEVFIKSSAGYSVLSYVLGVGDRHLDNLLLKKEGNFLHVDFGFMFGQDPKPIPVKVRVVEEMTQAMGKFGKERFLELCAIAFVAIRHCADEILCSLALMIDAQLPHLPKTKEGIANNLLANLLLNLSDEKAGEAMINTVNNAINSFLPSINEKLHQISNWVGNLK